MDISTIVAVLGPVIALLVQFLKKISFVANYPKVFAGVLGLVAVGITYFVKGDLGTGLAQLVQVAIDAFLATGSAVLSYEALKQQV